MRLRILDRYAIRLTVWPLLGTLGVTLVALLLERVLRLLEALSLSSDRFGFVFALAANLVPHYLGLSLPAAFFIALFIIAARLNDGSEIDAMLASGQSLTRLSAPFVALGLVLMILSLGLFGWAQPYSRYAYRAIMHSAQSTGWNGRLPEGTIITTSQGLIMTADKADAGGQSLQGVFIRQLDDQGQEQITTAKDAQIELSADGLQAVIALHGGRQLRFKTGANPVLIGFNDFTVSIPLAAIDTPMRARGGDERELTSPELVAQAAEPGGPIAVEALKGELYARLARSLTLPLLPLLAIPLGLAAKRSGRAPGIIVAGVILIAFQHLLQFGQGLASNGKAAALPAVGIPFAVFAFLCIAIFLASRKQPGSTPISRLAESLSLAFRRLGAMFVAPKAAQP